LFVLTRRSVPHIDMGTEPPLAHIGAVNPSSDARGNFQTTFAAFRTVFNALCRETNADPWAPRVGPPHRREDLAAQRSSTTMSLPSCPGAGYELIEGHRCASTAGFVEPFNFEPLPPPNVYAPRERAGKVGREQDDNAQKSRPAPRDGVGSDQYLGGTI
jgi:hypothetical protein